MCDSEKDLANEISYSANEVVSDFILRQAEERLRALQTAAHALDQRVTQVAAFQFAAAAVVAGLAANKDISLFAGVGSIAFIVGGLVAFRGVRSDEFHLPGIAPNWWSQTLSMDDFDIGIAKAWATGAYQTAITRTDVENCHRAQHLNVSLRYAACGSVMMAVYAFLSIFA